MEEEEPKLIGRLQGTNRESHHISKAQTIIGRADDCDVVINSKSVSSKHALLEFKNEKAFLTDMKSLNGTFINHNLLKDNTLQLKHGDSIRFGYDQTSYVLYIEKGLKRPFEKVVTNQKTKSTPEQATRIHHEKEQLKKMMDQGRRENEGRDSSTISFPGSEGIVTVPLGYEWKDRQYDDEEEAQQQQQQQQQATQQGKTSHEEEEKQSIKGHDTLHDQELQSSMHSQRSISEAASSMRDSISANDPNSPKSPEMLDAEDIEEEYEEDEEKRRKEREEATPMYDRKLNDYLRIIYALSKEMKQQMDPTVGANTPTLKEEEEKEEDPKASFLQSLDDLIKEDEEYDIGEGPLYERDDYDIEDHNLKLVKECKELLKNVYTKVEEVKGQKDTKMDLETHRDKGYEAYAKALQTELRRVKQQFFQAKDALTMLQEDKPIGKTLTDTLQDQIGLKDAEIAHLRKQVTELQTSIYANPASKKRLAQLTTNQFKELEMARAEIAEWRQRARLRALEWESLCESRNRLEKQVSSLQGTMQRQMNDFQTLMVSKEQQMNEWKRKIITLSAESETSSTSQQANRRAAAQFLVAELSRVERERNDAQLQVQHEKTVQRDLFLQQDQFKLEINSLRDTLQYTDADHVKNRIATLQDKLRDLQTQCSVDQVTQLKQTITSLNGRLQRVNRERLQLQRDLSHVEVPVDDLAVGFLHRKNQKLAKAVRLLKTRLAKPSTAQRERQAYQLQRMQSRNAMLNKMLFEEKEDMATTAASPNPPPMQTTAQSTPSQPRLPSPDADEKQLDQLIDNLENDKPLEESTQLDDTMDDASNLEDTLDDEPTSPFNDTLENTLDETIEEEDIPDEKEDDGEHVE